MASEIQKVEALRGGEFLIKDSDPQSVFIPEEITEEQRQQLPHILIDTGYVLLYENCKLCNGELRN